VGSKLSPSCKRLMQLQNELQTVVAEPLIFF